MRLIRKKLPRLKELRNAFGLTQTEVGKYLNMGKHSYFMIESGKANLMIDHLTTLALMYNVSSDYILGLSDCPSYIVRNERYSYEGMVPRQTKANSDGI